MSTVLVVAPHPDDEAIGCGGAICRHKQEHQTVNVVFLTSGEKGGHGRSEHDTKVLREQEAREAAKILGIDEIEFWGQPDGEVVATEELTKLLAQRLELWQPTTLYVTHDDEMHPDHRAAVQLVRQAIHQISDSLKPSRCWMYEVWTPMSTMDHIVDISDVIEQKLAAVRKYRTQCDVLKFDDAIEGLNRYRGEMHSWPGGPYAEVFRKLVP